MSSLIPCPDLHPSPKASRAFSQAAASSQSHIAYRCVGTALPGSPLSWQGPLQRLCRTFHSRDGTWQDCRQRLKARAYQEEPVTKLQSFLGWLVANGVQGIGRENSKVAAYETDEEERGLIAVKGIAQGELLFAVPLRLALKDLEGPGVENGHDAAWNVRLAARVLQEEEKPASPWKSYIQVLPQASSPCAFLPSPDAVAACGVPLGQLAPSLLRRLQVVWHMGGAAIPEPFSQQQLRWALQVVQSRTFGASAKNGQVVRMMLPLVDMLNHRGDETPLLPSQAFEAQENVRWDIVQSDGQQAMQVSATRGIGSGEELFLSYEERENDYFLVQYGFVPPQNPHDAVQLFAHLQAAEQWCQLQASSEGAQNPAQASDQDLAPAQTSLQQLSLADQHRVPSLQLYTRARLDPQLVQVLNGTARSSTGPGHGNAATSMAPASRSPAAAGSPAEGVNSTSREIIRGQPNDQAQLTPQGMELLLKRCWQLLHEGVTPLEHDLGLLAADESCDEMTAEVYVRQLQHYRQATSRMRADPASQNVLAQQQAADSGVQAHGPRLRDGMLDHTEQLILQFVSQKKMILWDTLFTVQQSLRSLSSTAP